MEFSYKPVNPFQDDGLSKEDRSMIDGMRNTAYICGYRGEDVEFAVHQALKRMGRIDLISSCERAESEDKMTRKEASFYLANMDRKYMEEGMSEALNMAIKVLEQEPCGDAISRQAVIEHINKQRAELKPDIYPQDKIGEAAYRVCIEFIKYLPPVTPQQKMGRWIPIGYDGYADGNPVYDWWECSECGWEHTGDEESLTAFCPNCGQPKMEVKE